MGFLTNQWSRYFTRSYQQLKSLIITDLAALTPEITDHTESNPFIKAVSIWSGIAEMLGYYIDNAAREAFIDSCRRYESAVKIARLMDYKILGCNSATVDVTFIIDVAAVVVINIPAGTEVQNTDGIKFFTTVATTIGIGNLETTVSAIQAETVINQLIGTSNGQANQVFVLGDNIVNDTVAIKISLISWNPVYTFGYSLSTAKDYLVTVNEDRQVIVKFGDGESGLIPTAGLQIFADYRTCQKELGNVEVLSINTINTAITVPVGITISVTNRNRASGGSSLEDLQSLKKKIPLYIRTLRRAVIRQDYIDVAEQAAGVAKAGVVFECGKTVDVYVVPAGGGIASGALLLSVLNWFEDKRMITTRVRVFPAGEVHVLLDIDIYVLPQYTRSVTVTNVLNNLTNFLSYANQTIGGMVQLSDIYEIVERTEGVNYSKLNKMTSRPYARPLDTITPQLNWTRNTQSTSVGTNKFKLVMISPTTFQLLRNTSYVGTYTVGVAVVLPEIVFTVNSGVYILGNGWEFITYDYYGSIILQEPSLPISDVVDITINPFGGI